MITKKRSLLGACIALIIGAVALAGGPPLAGVFTGSAQGAVSMHRVAQSCNKKTGFDSRYQLAQVDPIVAFGQAQSAHIHGFCWYFSVTSTTTAKFPIIAGHESDPGYAPQHSVGSVYSDWPMWWAPMPRLDGAQINPGPVSEVWQSPAGVNVATPPFGMTYVTGNAMATQPERYIRFTCGDPTGSLTGSSIDGPGSPTPHNCADVPGGVVTAEATFPNCWDGTVGYNQATQSYPGFDTPVGLSPNHFSYADANGNCPAGTIPCVPGRMIAQLVTLETFIDPATNKQLVNPLDAAGNSRLSFSSGSALTYHADFVNTESMDHLNGLVNQCLNVAAANACPPGTYVGLHPVE